MQFHNQQDLIVIFIDTFHWKICNVNVNYASIISIEKVGSPIYKTIDYHESKTLFADFQYMMCLHAEWL
jgi:hypothetical protein